MTCKRRYSPLPRVWRVYRFCYGRTEGEYIKGAVNEQTVGLAVDAGRL